MGNDAQYLLNNLMSLMTTKIYVPTDFHGRTQAVKEMQDNDVTGMVDSLTDFQVQSASVDFNIVCITLPPDITIYYIYCTLCTLSTQIIKLLIFSASLFIINAFSHYLP